VLQAAPAAPAEKVSNDVAVQKQDTPAYSAASILESIKNEEAVTSHVKVAPEPMAQPEPASNSEPEPRVVPEPVSPPVSERVVPAEAEAASAVEVVSKAPQDTCSPTAEEAAPSVARAAEMFDAVAADTDDEGVDVGREQVSASAAPEPATMVCIATTEITSQSWPAIYTRLDLSGVAKSVISHCALERVEAGDFHFVLEQRNAGLFNETYTAKLQESMARLTGTAVQLSIEIGEPTQQTPAEYLKAQAEARQAAAEARIMADPNVQMLMQRFDASIIPDSIEPILDEENA
jgi:DNA polymerase-3 subunit gamma/tau